MMFLYFVSASVSVCKNVSVLFLLSTLITVNKSIALSLKNMTVPLIADFRENMNLDCHFDMGTETLYAVKWYKDDHEFFRYMPHQIPQLLSYPVKGINMVPLGTDCSVKRCKVVLQNLSKEQSGGAYRCEISSEAPAFRLASETRNITIGALPKDNPRISGTFEEYQIGQELTATCTSGSASPTPTLIWYINEQKAPDSYVSTASTTLPDEEGLSSSSLSLKFPVEKKYVSGNRIFLKCVSSLYGVPVYAQAATQTVTVRSELLDAAQVKGGERLWSHDYSRTHRQGLQKELFVLVQIFACVRWFMYKIMFLD